MIQIFYSSTDITSPAPSSSTDLSSSAQLDVKRDYPRGIINPNYPGFQHLAHTLSEHFIDHHQNLEHSTDSEDDFEYESNDNLENNNAGNMNDSNNNTNNAAGVRDLNSNQNLRISSHSMYVDDKEDSNMQFQSKVFCDRKLFNLLNSDTNIESSNENLSAFENISSSGDEIDDEELDEELEPALINHFDGPDKEMTEVCEPSTRMEYDEDELDVSVEDDWAIKTELESIDKLSYDFESVDCDLETYLRRYDYPNNCKMFNSELIKEDIERQMECFMHDSRSLTPDILLEHGNKKTINDETSEVTKSTELTPESTSSSAINLDERNYQPDLIKNITDVIKTNGDDVQMARQFVEKIMSDSDNENLTIFKHEATNANDQQARSLELFLNNNENVANSELDSFGEECATAPDIVGDFEKEIEQEIGLIVSGYQMKYIKSPEYDCALDEQKFMEHIQNFSKVKNICF